MPKITINGTVREFTPGDVILKVANEGGQAIPQYCYHPGLSIVASCRICLAEVWQPDPRTGNLAPLPKLVPTCQTTCVDGMVVYTDSPKAIANQKSVMEYLLINHPLDCPVCDQAGECLLQDYSYEYGRGVSRFEETKVKQPKKDLGPHVYLYADRCIMCTRCVRFCREVTGTAELVVDGRGNQEQIDIFPGAALANELSANVIDLCPVGALLDKDFLFAQRVWFLKSTPSIDGTTAGGDNILIEHNAGKIYRLKPRDNAEVNKWWISDEVRFGWKFVHAEDRLTMPAHTRFGRRAACDWSRAYDDALAGLREVIAGGGKAALMVSPMLSCEDAFALARAARAIDANCTFAVGPIPRIGQDKTFPGGYTITAEKCPNARGVRRVLEALSNGAPVLTYEQLRARAAEFGALILTGNYTSEWATEDFADACAGRFIVLIDTLPSRLTEREPGRGGANVILPGATWAEKAGTFENYKGRLQAFEQAIPVIEYAKAEAQIGLDLLSLAPGAASSGDRNGAMSERGIAGEVSSLRRPDAAPLAARLMELDAAPGQVSTSTEVMPATGVLYNAADLRGEMARMGGGLSAFASEVHLPTVTVRQEADMEIVEL